LYTVVAASQKGGSGKTTLSGHLAVEADRAGVGPVALIDTDPQASLSHWWNARTATSPHFVKVGVLDLGAALEQLRENGFKLVVIDTPPAITESISHVVAHADLVLVPTRPSPHDLRAVGATVDIAERHRKPIIFVINAATARARITAQSAVVLSQHGTVAPIMLHHRVDFAASMVDGRTVGEIVAKSPSAKEISDLWLYVQDRLFRLKRDPALLPELRPQFSIDTLSPWSNEPVEESPSLSPESAPGEMQGEPTPVVQPYAGPEKRHDPPGTPYAGVERRVNSFGRRTVSPSIHYEDGKSQGETTQIRDDYVKSARP
jgi:chromosome partitioning protein